MGTVVVLGSLIIDLVARAPRLPSPGEALIGDEFATFIGGKGLNQAIAAARLGAQVSLIGQVGTDAFGDSFFPILAQEGVDSGYVTRAESVGTGVSSVLIGEDSGQNVIVALPRANLTLQANLVQRAMQELMARQKQDSSPSVFLAQCETSMDSVSAGLQEARKAGMITMLNAAPIPREAIPSEIFTLTDVLIVNETEATSLTGITVDSPTAAKREIEQLLARGPQHAIITLGAQGAIWCTREEDGPCSEWIRAFPVTPVDVTAAGDAFCGALAAGLAEGMQMYPAMYRASAAGAVATTRKGAYPSLPTHEEVDALMKEYED